MEAFTELWERSPSSSSGQYGAECHNHDLACAGSHSDFCGSQRLVLRLLSASEFCLYCFGSFDDDTLCGRFCTPQRIEIKSAFNSDYIYSAMHCNQCVCI